MVRGRTRTRTTLTTCSRPKNRVQDVVFLSPLPLCLCFWCFRELHSTFRPQVITIHPPKCASIYTHRHGQCFGLYYIYRLRDSIFICPPRHNGWQSKLLGTTGAPRCHCLAAAASAVVVVVPTTTTCLIHIYWQSQRQLKEATERHPDCAITTFCQLHFYFHPLRQDTANNPTELKYTVLS